MTPETAVYQFVQELVDAAADPAPLAGAAVHATRYEPIATPTAIRVGDAAVDVGPRSGVWKEFNAELLLEIVSRVDGGDHVAARDLVREMSLAIAEAIQSDAGLGGRVCEARIVAGTRGWARVQTTAFSVQVFRLLIDPHGYRGG
jgi:hypothetical protein